MKLINCPLNGPRNAQEFICAGAVKIRPGETADRIDWADYIFLENNRAGVVLEWWCHTPSAYWFIAERDTTTDNILRTFPVSAMPVEDQRREVPE